MMVRSRSMRRPNGSPESPVRTVRVDKPTWEKATRRAKLEGMTMSAVLLAFVEGYGQGKINLPLVQLVYEPQQALGE